MLPRSQRLNTAAFATAFRNGRVLRHPLLHLRVYSRQNGSATTRAAFVAPKKLGTAILRNRTRRRVSERYRVSAARRQPRPGGWDLIFLATPAAVTADTVQLDAAIAQLLARAASGPGTSGTVGGERTSVGNRKAGNERVRQETTAQETGARETAGALRTAL